MTDPIQSLSLYYCSGPKAFFYPFSGSAAEITSSKKVQNPILRQATVTPRAGGGLRLKFTTYPRLWFDMHDASVQSHQLFMDLVRVQQEERNLQYLCCADLNIRGAGAGTHFFQQMAVDVVEAAPKQDDTATMTPVIEMACLQLANTNKIRIIQLPASERPGLSRTIATHWSQHGGVQRADKYGLEVYKLMHHPWCTSETSKDLYNVDARKLVLAMLSYMDQNGWQRVVPFDCTTSDRDADSLLFYRDSSWTTTTVKVSPLSRREFCAVSLEREHKIRLIGRCDEMTQTAFGNATQRHWRVQETNRFSDNLQIKLIGRPWRPQTTLENIRSAKLMCGILQDLWQQGWRWHCAVDLSCSVADKSTFYLSRELGKSNDDDGDMRGGRIGCVQPKGRGKVNLVSFPPSALHRAIEGVRRARWGIPVMNIEWQGEDSATIHFQDQNLHFSCSTDDKSKAAKVYTALLCIVACAAEGTALLGTGDISGNHENQRDSNGRTSTAYSLDTDAFFLWFPFVQ